MSGNVSVYGTIQWKSVLWVGMVQGPWRLKGIVISADDPDDHTVTFWCMLIYCLHKV